MWTGRAGSWVGIYMWANEGGKICSDDSKKCLQCITGQQCQKYYTQNISEKVLDSHWAFPLPVQPCWHSWSLRRHRNARATLGCSRFLHGWKNKQGQVNTTGWWKINKCNTAKPKSLGAPVLLFEKVPQVLLRQFCGYVTHPERRARTSEMEGEAEQ